MRQNTTGELMARLAQLGIRLWLEGEELHYSAPDGVLTAALRAELTARKEELVALLHEAGNATWQTRVPLTRVSRQEDLPLSFAQERLWFLDQLDPHRTTYNIPLALRLEGELNVRALEQSLNEVIQRHESLRTTFVKRDGQPRQVIAPAMTLRLEVQDWRDLADAERAARGTEHARAEQERGFDLERGPLLRASLARLGDREYVLWLTMHHIIADGWSLGVLSRELSHLYAAFVAGRESSLPELKVQYPDYAVWQRGWLQGEVLEEQLCYWRERLHGAPPVLDLPLDGPRPAVETHRGGTVRLQLSRELSEGLAALSRREGVTLFMTLLAGFQALLARYSGQEDIVVGSPIANRHCEEVEGLIGFFVNTLALRTDVSGDPSFSELIARVRQVALGAYAHQDVPFEKLVEALQPQRNLSHHPLFQVMFALQNMTDISLDLAGLKCRAQEMEPVGAKFDLSVDLSEGAEGVHGPVQYNADLFERATIERLARHYVTLLAGAVANPKSRVSQLPLLTQIERQQLLVEWNRTEQAFPEACVHQLLEDQVRRSPESVAVVFKEQSLTYTELNRRANQLAHHLQKRGVGPDVLVGLCLERSLEMAVGMIGVLKAGGAYVPLDPAYPRERLEFMVRDSGAPVLLTQRSLVDRLPSAAVQVLCLDRDWKEIDAESGENPVCRARPEHLAYVIYTSGSTGQPKGVAIEHRNTMALLHWARMTYSSDELSGVLASTSICFDLSVFEIFVPLSWGGCAVVVENVLELLSLSRAHEVTLINTVPSAIAELVRANGVPRSVRTINLAGEPLTQRLADDLYELPGVQKVYDLYGPSEDTTYSTCALRTVYGLATIGRPIANTQAYILDRSLQPVPIGASGELCLSGSGLARGYLNRPELTAEKFIRHPFSADPKARLYRTGDLARYRSDGNIEFLGRIDHQVKVRGFRIELGEIESVMVRHKAVDKCVVMVREDEPGDRRLVAYVVLNSQARERLEDLRGYLQEKLPDYMVPSTFVPLEKLPLTSNGKLDRQALPAPSAERSARREYVAPQSEVEQCIARIWSELLGVGQVGRRDNFFDLGGHSLLLVRVHTRLQEDLGRVLSIVELFQYPTIEALARHLTASQEPGLPERRRQELNEGGVAIVGMSGRFPGAEHLEQFWQNLRQGIETIRLFTAEELEAAGADPMLVRQPQYVRAKGVLEGVELFDAGFFGYSPREAQILDPQQRVFLECAWEALERAGYDPERYGGRIGVYGGVSLNTYWDQLKSDPDLMDSAGDFQVIIGSDKDFLPTRVSYKLNLRGPSLNVQTACSTSLVAVHLACQSLFQGEADMALAGGVSITVPVKSGYLYQEAGIASPDGHCRTFDARAEGTVAGNGVGIVVLKRIRDALRDGDQIYAVIKGSAINNDGAGKVGFTAPSVTGQAEVILAAQAQAGVSAETISYVEAHGTATALGDPIEVEALAQAFRAGTDQKGFCAIGSVKSNVGHLDTAAGVTGLIKTALALHHGEIPPSLHYEQPNPKIDFPNSPFFVNGQLREWKRSTAPRRAGVSSFGIGGTNAHVVLEEPPERERSGSSRSWQLLLLSAKTATALESATRNLRQHLEAHPEQPLADAAYTLQVGRKAFAHRRVVVCREREEALAALANPEAPVMDESNVRPLVFLFSGQGAQYVGMGRELYETEPVFREVVDRCAALLKPRLGLDLRDVLSPAKVTEVITEQLNQTALAQPALFVIEYALAQLWGSWGIKPQAMIGHSIGEYVAAVVAGVMSVEDGLRLVAARGRLMQGMAKGAMLSVALSVEEAEKELATWPLDVAVDNGPRQTVVSGPVEAIEALAAQLRDRGVASRRLATSHAFHSAMMEPMLAEFLAEVKRARLSAPAMPYLTNVTGTWIRAEQATDPEHWVRHVRQTVRFSPSVKQAQALVQGVEPIYVEVGPGRTLTQLVAQQSSGRGSVAAVSSLRPEREKMSDPEHLMRSLGRLWQWGVRVDWAAHHGGQRRSRVLLPTYPFERERHWVERRPLRAATRSGTVSRSPDLADWFFVPAWKGVPLPRVLFARDWSDRKERWLLLIDDAGVGVALVDQLERRGQEVIQVGMGDGFTWKERHRCTVNPASRHDYETLCRELQDSHRVPHHIVHLWTLGADAKEHLNDPHFERTQQRGFYSLLFLAQAMAREQFNEPLRIAVISNALHAVGDDERGCPAKATMLGPCHVIPQEYANIGCRTIDVLLPQGGTKEYAELAGHLANELIRRDAGPVTAYRGRHRWTQSFEPARCEPLVEIPARLRPGGVYLMTGGFGKVGLALAEYLARTVKAKLVLIGRSAFPERSKWSAWVDAHGEQDVISGRIRKLESLEQLGAEVLILAADVADRRQMAAAVSETERRFGALHGVIHAAGVPKGISIQQLTPADCEEQFQAKVQGLLSLADALAGRKLDFCLLTSSLSSILGGLGFAAYAAANQFMDAYARLRSGEGAYWISVNWDGWDFKDIDHARGHGAGTLTRLALSAEEGAEAFARVLTMEPLERVAVSTASLPGRIEQWVRSEPQSTSATAVERVSPPRRAGVAETRVAPRNEIEERIAGIWQQALGLKEVDVRDDFLQLGGNSLIAVQMLPRLRKAFQVELPVQTLFDARTIEQLARAVEQAQAEAMKDVEQIERLLAMVEQTPEGQLEALVDRRTELQPKSGTP